MMIAFRFYSDLLSFFLPGICIHCKQPLTGGRVIICAVCFSNLQAIDNPTLLALKNEVGNYYIDDIWIAYQFSHDLQLLIHLLKYGKYTVLCDYFGESIQKIILKGRYDLVTAVPLHPVRIRERGFNQSALIARRVSALTCIPYSQRLLVRIKNTISQTRLSREERMQNVKNSFLCHFNLKGLAVLIIDDVITTGSTVNACSRVLKDSGAALVDVAALATPASYVDIRKDDVSDIAVLQEFPQ